MEILSPAGNIKLVNAALNANSNAVYGGFKNWNARNSAINFTKEEYNYSVNLLHENNIKFYLTLNNLCLDYEIEEIINYLKQDDVVKPDAFIVADLGLIQALNENFPNIDIHVSTQFGTHNVSDLKLLEKLGVKRAILAREITREELENLRKNTNLELEVFIWGSQCLSFSGLCFFGSLINGGTGNRGKCINLCRDNYMASKNRGTLLYVSDMNCINLINNLNEIDSLKIEGRRRQPKEVENVIKEIKEKKSKDRQAGFLYGENNEDNKMINVINNRIKPLYQAKEMKNIEEYDVFAKFDNEIPLAFCKSKDENAYYIYSELLDSYEINKKNYLMEINFDDYGNLLEASITNYKGENTLITSTDDKYINFDAKEFKEKILEVVDKDIKIGKIKFKKPLNKKLKISEQILSEIIEYFKSQKGNHIKLKLNNNFKGINYIYIQTSDLNVVDRFIDENNIKIIYEISSISELKTIDKMVQKYGGKIIYRLPIFNWKSEDLKPYYNKLRNLEVMFTRYSQLLDFQDIPLKKKYVDYLVYAWNKKVLKFLKEHNIEEFTATPELSVEQNENIYENENIQFILAGRPALVYTRNCLKNVLECKVCKKDKINYKPIFNESKKLNFIISCKQDHREIYYKELILNDYSKMLLNENVKYRLISNGFTISEIENFIEKIKSKDYYKSLLQEEIWKNSYECNLYEGRN